MYWKMWIIQMTQEWVRGTSNLLVVNNLGQKLGDKFTKFSKIGFSMECVTADFLQFFTKIPQILTFGWTAGYSPSNQTFQGFSWNFLIS